tara:strand:- start:365 stop:1483 length:1119 start_codon:yes stop_codon:yes gene_type:complete
MIELLSISYLDIYLLWQFLPFLILLYYYFNYLAKLSKSEPFKTTSENLNVQAVSIVIAAKDEAANLKLNLPFLLRQDFKEFEIIIVNDHSIDETVAIVKSFNDSRISVVDLELDSGKKAAIQRGVLAARNEHLLFIDADCQPASNDWLNEMMAAYLPETEIVLGHGRFKKSPGFLNAFLRYECFSSACQYFSFAVKGNAYMGVGRNLSYKKSLFEKSKSLKKHSKILSGDDDLLVNEMANEKNVNACILPQAHTISEAKTTWWAYFAQKRRQLQAGNYYKASHRFRLFIFGFAHLVFNISTLILLLISLNIAVILSIFVVKMTVQFYFQRKIAKQLGDKDLQVFAGFLEIIYYPLISIIGISTWIWKIKKWK